MTTLSAATVLVTGASSGIGEATVRRLAADGADVALLSRREDALRAIADDVAETHGVDTHVVPADVSDPAEVQAAIESTVETLGSLDGVVANAGLGRGSDVEGMDEESYRTMMDVNVDGAFYTARDSLPYLRDGDGVLVFVGSFAGQYPRSYNAVYAASKWWTRGFAKSVAAQVGDDGVGVTVVNPGAVRTEFEAADGQAFEDVFEEGEASEPEEVAEAIVFAASRDGSSISEIDINNRSKFADDF